MGNDAKIAMVIASIIFAAIGAYFISTAYGQEVAVDVDGQIIANLQLMHTRSLGMMIGLGAALASALFSVGALIVGGLERRD